VCQITAGAVERAAVRAEDDDVVAAARRREGARVWRGHPAHRGLRRATHGVGAAASSAPRMASPPPPPARVVGGRACAFVGGRGRRRRGDSSGVPCSVAGRVRWGAAQAA